MDIQTKDGIILRNIPEGTPDDEIKARIQQIRAGNVPENKNTLLPTTSTAYQDLQQKPESIDPTSNVSGLELYGAGIGKSVYDVGRGIGQMTGVMSQKDIDEAKALDKPLMDTTAGALGNVSGNTLMALPTMAIPGANTVIGGGLIGGGLAALQPTATGESRGNNMLMGAAAGGAVPALVGAGRAVKSAVYDPIAGQDKVIGGALARMAGDNPQALASALKSGGAASTPGVKFSAGTISGNEGIAALEDAIRAQVPSGQLSQAAQQNRTALASAIRGVAKTPEELALAKEARTDATSPIYEKIKNSDYPLNAEFSELLKRPAILDAMKAAELNALNKGTQIRPIQPSQPNVITPFSQQAPQQMTSGQTLHEIKMALDAAKTGNPILGIDKAKLAGVEDAATAYNNWLEGTIPDYAMAKDTFSQMSQPINEMQVGKYLSEKLIPATAGDAPASLNYSSLARSMQNPDAVAKLGTKYKGATFDNAVRPEAKQTILGVTSDASKIAEALKRGVGNNSATARRLTQGDILNQHFAQNAPVTSKVLEVLGRIPPVTMAGRLTSGVSGIVTDKIKNQILTNMDNMLANNPQQVAKLIEQELKSMNPSQRQQIINYLPQSVVLGLSANSMQQ